MQHDVTVMSSKKGRVTNNKKKRLRKRLKSQFEETVQNMMIQTDIHSERNTQFKIIKCLHT